MVVNIKRDNKAVLRVEKIGKLGEKSLKTALTKSGEAVRNTAIKSIQRLTEGYLYFNRARGKKVRAGKMGLPPNTQTGNLVGKIIKELNANGKSMYVGSNVDYAEELEYGNHPFLEPALNANQKTIEKIVENELKKALDNA